MAKYHINSKGEPAICKAKKGNCPFGGSDTHYDSLADAQAEANRRNEQEYSLLPKTNKKKNYYKKAKSKADKQYLEDRKDFLRTESPAPTYIMKCKSCTRIKNPDFYTKERAQETYHFDKERKERLSILDKKYGEGETIGFYNVNHRIKGKNYIEQVVEVKSTGQLVIYDKKRGHKVTAFMAHRARVETMMILAGEIPDKDFMKEVNKNHTDDLQRQKRERGKFK